MESVLTLGKTKASAVAGPLDREDGRLVLWIVLAINLLMFTAEVGFGLASKSLALIGDSLDMLGDAVMYGTSLIVLIKGPAAKPRADLLKNILMGLTGVLFLAWAVYQLATRSTPFGEVVGAVGLLALFANLICLILLIRHRQDSVTMGSIWLCSKNDILASALVIFAGFLVLIFRSPWPDFLVGLALAGLFFRSALEGVFPLRARLRAVHETR